MRRLGLPSDEEARVRSALDRETGMLVVDTVRSFMHTHDTHASLRRELIRRHVVFWYIVVQWARRHVHVCTRDTPTPSPTSAVRRLDALK